ncbi:MAG: alpha/beta fold hydrolase [Phycisphaerales bacterium]
MNRFLPTIVTLSTFLIATISIAFTAPDEQSLSATPTATQSVTPAAAPTAIAEAPAVEYIHRTLEIDDQEYNWTIMIPPGAQRGGPAILFLHGLGAGGSKGTAHIRYGLAPAIEQDPESWPFIVIIPQKTSRSAWDFHEDAVMQMLDIAVEEELIDPDNIGITGLSQGGHGSMVFAANHPERFKAIAPVCGYAQIAYDEEGNRTPSPSMGEYHAAMMALSSKLKDRPMWLFHGSDDKIVPAAASRVMNMTLKTMEADVKYTEFPDTDHNAWDPAYAMPELGEWFSTHLSE